MRQIFFKNILLFFQTRWHFVLLIFFICLMVYPYFYLSLNASQKFYSPDETANFVFVNEFIKHNKLFLIEPLNPEIGNIILPRSVNISGSRLVPQSFLGLLIIYGLIGKITGPAAVIFFTPIISLLTIVIFYFLILEIFSNKNSAFWSALFLLFNPVFWFTAGKAMLHTNLFIFFIILGLLFLFKSFKKNNFVNIGLSAMFIGLALTVRTSEIAWLGLFLLIFYFFQRKHLNYTLVFAYLFILTTILTGLLFLNHSVYANIFISGYSSLDSNPTENNLILNFIKTLFLPFGFKLKYAAIQFYNFFVKSMWHYFIPSFIGLIYLLKKKKELNSKIKTFVCALSVVSIYLIVFYGSYWPWGQSGQPSTMIVNIGGPHFRYWLPIFAMQMPMIYIFFDEIIPKVFNLQKSGIKNIILACFLIFIAATSTNTVFFNQDEGFLKIKQDIADFAPRLAKVQQIIPANSALIVPAWADRIFFPEFPVIYSVEDAKIHRGDIFSKIKKLAQIKPIYYYSASSADDIADLNAEKLNKYNLNLIKIADIFKSEQLYELQQLK